MFSYCLLGKAFLFFNVCVYAWPLRGFVRTCAPRGLFAFPIFFSLFRITFHRSLCVEEGKVVMKSVAPKLCQKEAVQEKGRTQKIKHNLAAAIICSVFSCNRPHGSLGTSSPPPMWYFFSFSEGLIVLCEVWHSLRSKTILGIIPKLFSWADFWVSYRDSASGIPLKKWRKGWLFFLLFSFVI